MNLIQRLFLISVLCSILLGYQRSSAMDGAFLFIVLMLVLSFSWGIMSWDEIKQHLGIHQANILALATYVVTSIGLGLASIEFWEFPSMGAYITAFITMATVWWTMHAMQPANV